MARLTPPLDPNGYACISWDGYRADQLAHWAWPTARGIWRTFCGQQQVSVRAAAADHVCAICARGYAKISAQYDADHMQDAPAGV